MKLNLSARNMSIGKQLEQRIETKLGKLDRYFGEEAEAEVKLRTEGEDKYIEITIRVQKHLYRAESRADDVFTALDLVLSNMERQIRKQKSKIEKRIRDYAYMKEALKNEAVTFDEKEEDTQILRKKSFALTAITPDEAALQMEMLGHTFHLFLHAETGKVALIYKRKDGHYGLIEPQY